MGIDEDELEECLGDIESLEDDAGDDAEMKSEGANNTVTNEGSIGIID